MGEVSLNMAAVFYEEKDLYTEVSTIGRRKRDEGQFPQTQEFEDDQQIASVREAWNKLSSQP